MRISHPSPRGTAWQGAALATRTLLAPLAIVALLIALPGISWATSVQLTPLEDMASDSTMIVRGRVVGEEVRWEDGHLWTLRQIAVEREYREGVSLARVVTLRTPGGRLGDIATRVAGVEQARLGDEVVLFLRRDVAHAGTWRTTALAWSLFHVVDRPEGATLVRSLQGAEGWVAAQHHLQTPQRIAITATEIALVDFEAWMDALREERP